MNLAAMMLATASILASPAMIGDDPPRPDRLVTSFEGRDWGDWTAEGEAFADGPSRPKVDRVGLRGDTLADSFAGDDAKRGTLTSPAFAIERDHLALLIGGGERPEGLGAELLIDGEAVRSATGHNDGALRWASWDVREFNGRSAQVRIVDQADGEWGHVLVDEIIQTDQPRSGSGAWRLEEYRRSDHYLGERYRPQYHFSPELNWTNDPNGLVFFEGEYHLFYQHNPLGNTWGHMSWGHAVSPDLLHWEHLPIALREEYGVMIFSGSAVVDVDNTSGFGVGDEPPLVAIYTGHGDGRQTQDIAYSNDRGRSWTKYGGNPVLDLGMADFRDPKVFRHLETDRWVMVVSLANEKRLQFYASENLKDWTFLSEFGPAGVAEKPNWECPDLFPLAIEGEPGEVRWLLETDIGGGAIAGGSGGEYFVGTFDGTRFVPDSPESQWVDHGRDFYAPVSWSGIPEADGRRIWIGWMNNWETANVPTQPWRGSMSLPRSLSLRRTPDGLRLVQHPIQELESLRRDHVHLEDRTLDNGALVLPIDGQQLEVKAEFESIDAAEFGVRVLRGPVEATVVGIDAAHSSLFVDRNRSGDVAFHDRFAGRHDGPIRLEGGRARLHLFVDASSVEVFGDDGLTVITDRVFPDPESRGVELFATGGRARLVSLDAWTLAPASPTR